MLNSRKTRLIMRIKLPIAVLTAILTIGPFLFGQPPQTPAAQAAADLAKYIQDNYTKTEVMVPMRDGVKLFTSIYAPKAKMAGGYPIMFDRTPYSVAPYGKDAFRANLGPDALFAREGYIFAYQ